MVEVIYLQRYYWTSDALTWDGHLYWGHLPTTIQDPGGTHNASRIMSFDGNGHIVNEFELPHRAGGLAYDGTSFWALDISWPGIYRYDTNGTILETVPIEHDRNLEELRYPVQYVLRPNLDYRSFAGRIASGVVSKGDRVVVRGAGERISLGGAEFEVLAPPADGIPRPEPIAGARGHLEKLIVGDEQRDGNYREEGEPAKDHGPDDQRDQNDGAGEAVSEHEGIPQEPS